MRNYLLPALASAALVVAGCSSSQAPTSDATNGAKPASAATAITGTVSLRNPATAPELTEAAQMKVSLVDISQQPALTVASNTVAPVASLPIQFSLPFSPSDIMPTDLYVVEVAIVDGVRQYTMPLQQLVLTKGHDTNVKITLQAQATPSEKMLDEFKEVKAQLGGMKVSQGSALDGDVSRAWQSFRKAGKLEFVRSIEDLDGGAKGRTDTDYAYKDSKPWVIVQRHLPSPDAKPSSIDRAGWDSMGVLVVKEHEANGEVTNLDAAAAEQLRTDAETAFKRAGGDQNKR